MKKQVIKHKDTLKKQGRILVFLLPVLFIVMATACTKEPGKTQNPSATPAENATLSPTQEASNTPTPTETPTPTSTPTSTPTPTPTVALARLAERSAELHEAIRPKTVANALGTAPAYSEADKLDIEYGILRKDVINVTEKIIYRDGPDTTSYKCLVISGLTNGEACEKINKRLDEIARTMSDPDYLPDEPGVLILVKENGLPNHLEIYYESEVYQGILSVAIYGTWKWNVKGSSNNGAGSDWHYESEMISVNFDLWTGEELSLSDLFPEGYDYIEFLNNELENGMYYDYWFKSDYGPGRGAYGDEYDESLEYDGGKAAVKMTGDEEFYILSWGNINTRVEFSLPFLPPTRGQGERLSYASPEYVFSDLGSAVICQFYSECLMPVQPVAIGKFTIKPDGSNDVLVTVYRDAEPSDVDIPKEFMDKYFTDAKVMDYAKQWAAQWTGSLSPYDEINLFCESAALYPKDYYTVKWSVLGRSTKDTNSGIYGTLIYDPSMTYYFYEGKLLSLDEMFDVPFEEVLTELIANLETYNGVRIAVGDQAAKAAKALAPYFVGYIAEPEDKNYEWYWYHWLFRWKEGGMLTTETTSGVPIKDELPEQLWKSLYAPYAPDTQALRFSDVCIIQKHLKMYEGYPIE